MQASLLAGVWVRDEPFRRVARMGSALRAIFAKDELQFETIAFAEEQ